ncbi:MAG TPA: gephyrin-like molybdotransferase Glp [Thiobacillaceae bacterium]|nr:gephyrin-like molybdotransferase Glp [Thiobacillaceae bacterium]
MLSAEQLLTELLKRARPLEELEVVNLDAALGRVLGRGVVSSVTVPPLDNSAMDGYAVRIADVQAGVPMWVSQRIVAGRLGQPLQTGTAARIFTGAPIPPGADAVVMQEDAIVEGEEVRFPVLPRLGQHIRRSGEDIMAGCEVLSPGARLGAAELGLAASAGAASLGVVRRLKVAIFSTGDELAEPGEPINPGQIYNSNRYTLTGLLQGLNADLRDFGRVPDALDATVRTLEQAADWADVVITSGGVSVGEEDHVKAALEKLGRLEMWKVAMKPGKPVVYGQVNEADFIGLPGNPVSVFATFCLFTRPFLLKRMGATRVLYRAFPLKAAFDWASAGERREFLRGLMVSGADGGAEVRLYPNQSSGVLTSAVWGDGFVDIGVGQTVSRGDWVRFIPFGEVLG